MSPAAYQLVRLATGAHSIHSRAHGETFHPVIGPVAEAEALYVHQLRLVERLQAHPGEFVVWDVGLGAAANSLTVLRAARASACPLRLISFDHTPEPLSFALQHADELGYLNGYEAQLAELLRSQRVNFQNGAGRVNWEFQLGDFPTWCAQALAHRALNQRVSVPGSSHAGVGFAAPHAILFDAYSPAKNPAMWTLPLFTQLFQLLDPQRPCALPTYSRSTILRVTLLQAGFFVGVGHATGEKEETTIAANTLALIEQPLDRRWLDRACRSHSAEPLHDGVYRIGPLTSESRAKLQAHPQFQR